VAGPKKEEMTFSSSTGPGSMRPATAIRRASQAGVPFNRPSFWS